MRSAVYIRTCLQHLTNDIHMPMSGSLHQGQYSVFALHALHRPLIKRRQSLRFPLLHSFRHAVDRIAVDVTRQRVASHAMTMSYS